MKIINPFLLLIALIQIVAAIYYCIIKEPILGSVQFLASAVNILMSLVRG
jgi:uncharacterized membrane protein